METACPEVLNRTNLTTRRRAHRRNARADCFAVLVNRAGTTQGDAAAKLCTGQSKDVTEVPKEGHLGITIEGAIHPIYFEFDHCLLLLFLTAFRVPRCPVPLEHKIQRSLGFRID